MGIDNDCDGIDGTKDEAIFVDAESGTDANDGSFGNPVKTISKGIELAKAENPMKEVYVAAGVYEERVVVVDGVSLYGGFDAKNDWDHSGHKLSVVKVSTADESGAVIGAQAQNVESPTAFEFFEINATSDASLPGSSVYGVWCKNCVKFYVGDCKIVTSDGTDGEDGANGAAGAGGSCGGGGIAAGLYSVEEPAVALGDITGNTYTVGEGGLGGESTVAPGGDGQKYEVYQKSAAK